MSQILDKKNANGTSVTDNNAGAGAGDTSGTKDSGGTISTDINSNSKNAHAKASFSTYNVVNGSANADAGDIIGTGDISSTNSADMNADSKNAYAKAGFSTYNIASMNVDAVIGKDNTSSMGEKVSNNTNNIREGLSDRVGGID